MKLFLKLLQFEFNLHFRSYTLYIMILLFSILGIDNVLDFDHKGINDASPYRINFFIASMSIGSIFIAVILTIHSVLRDKKNKFEEIVFSTALTKNNYFLSRYLGIFLCTLIVNSFAVFGYFLGLFTSGEYSDSIPFNFLHYLWPWFIFMSVNVFIHTAIVYSTAVLTRSSIYTYLSGLLILVFFWINSIYIKSPLIGGNLISNPKVLDFVSMIDSFGLAAFFKQSLIWTPYEKNNLMIELSGEILINRIIWICFILLLLIASYYKFSFRIVNQKSKTVAINEDQKSKTKYRSFSASIEPKTNQLNSYISLNKISFYDVFKNKAFAFILLAWGVLIFSASYFMMKGEDIFGSRYPTTDFITGIVSESLEGLGLIIIVFYSGELIWKSRDLNFHEILFSAPVSKVTFFISKISVLSYIVFLLITIGILFGLTLQCTSGYTQYNILLYLSLYYYSGIPLILIGLFSLFMQIVFRRKYIAMILTGGIILFFRQLSPQFISNQPMLQFLVFERISSRYSDLTGYGQFAKPFHGMLIYWSSIIAILTLFSLALWNRKIQLESIVSQKLILKKIFLKNKNLASLFLLIFIASSGYNYYNFHILNKNSRNKDSYLFNEQYEKKYKKYESLPIPQIVDVKTEVEIFPSSRRYKVKANYKIENTGNKNIQHIFLCSKKHLKEIELENSNLVFKDSHLKSALYILDKPLKPGEQLTLRFKVDEKIVGYDSSLEVMENGSCFSHADFDPYLGYVNFLEIEDHNERKKRGLPKRKKLAYNDPHLQASDKFSFHKVNYENIISTSKDQTAIASGQLINQWQQNNRNYFHFCSESKIKRTMSYYSARYQKQTRSANGVNIEMYYHPSHHHNINAIMDYTEATLNYTSSNFSPYQHDHLRIVEVSGQRGYGGRAMAGVISMSEKSMYTKDITNPDEKINVVARRTIHEVAHQWWGHQLSPKKVEGGTILTEALCKYTEAVVLEKLLGKGMQRRLANYTLRRYLISRANANSPEPPLYLTSTQTYLGYSKGYMVLSALKELLGEKQVNLALQNLLTNHCDGPTATSLDLINELYNVAPKKHHRLIDDWMKKVIVYDLKLSDVSYKNLLNGKYEVSIQIKAHRYETQETGKKRAINIDEPIKIGLFSKHPNNLKLSETAMHLQTVHIKNNTTNIKITVDNLPKYIGIDPYLTRIDIESSDNLIFLDANMENIN